MNPGQYQQCEFCINLTHSGDCADDTECIHAVREKLMDCMKKWMCVRQERDALRAELAAACGCRVFDQNLIECEYHAAQSDELRAARAEIARLRELVKYAWFQAVEWAKRDPGDDPEESFNAHRVSDLVEAPPKMRRAALDGGKGRA